MSDRLVEFGGGVVRYDPDPAELEKLRLSLRDGREGEEFTASVDCPDCGQVDVHWLDEPRFEGQRDDSPVGQAMREINRSIAFVAALHGGSSRRQFDPLGTVVARICRACGYRWGQR